MALRASSALPILCAVVDCEMLGADPTGYALQLYEAGVDWIQLRDRSVESGRLLRVTRSLVAARDAMDARRRVLVNKRLDVAWAAGADGVHLGVDALDANHVAALLAPGGSIGRSFHSLAEVEAFADGAQDNAQEYTLDYAHLAPIWDPHSKPATRPPLGVDVLARACRAGLPILAQGGIDSERARAAIHAGAAGVAVTGLLARAGNPFDPIRQLRRALDGVRGSECSSPPTSAARNRGASR